MHGSIAPALGLGQTPYFGYSINLDERGCFEADVRDPTGATVFEVTDGASLGEDDTSIFEDGYMRHRNDIDGLQTYLIEVGIMPPDGLLLSLYDQEKALDRVLSCEQDAD